MASATSAQWNELLDISELPASIGLSSFDFGMDFPEADPSSLEYVKLEAIDPTFPMVTAPCVDAEWGMQCNSSGFDGSHTSMDDQSTECRPECACKSEQAGSPTTIPSSDDCCAPQCAPRLRRSTDKSQRSKSKAVRMRKRPKMSELSREQQTKLREKSRDAARRRRLRLKSQTSQLSQEVVALRIRHGMLKDEYLALEKECAMLREIVVSQYRR